MDKFDILKVALNTSLAERRDGNYLYDEDLGFQPMLYDGVGSKRTAPYQVAAFTVLFKDGAIRYGGQACMSYCANIPGAIAVASHIQGGEKRDPDYHGMTDEEAIRYLQYLMDHELFYSAFYEHDAAKALEERIVLHDVTKLPADQQMFAMTAVRSLWEQPFNQTPRRFCHLVDAGLSPDFAYLMAHWLVKSKKVGLSDDFLLNTPVGNYNHACISYINSGADTIKNFLAHRVTIHAPGTMSDGVPYYSPNKGYGVNNLFNDAFRNAYDPNQPGLKTVREILIEKLDKKAITSEDLISMEKEYVEA